MNSFKIAALFLAVNAPSHMSFAAEVIDMSHSVSACHSGAFDQFQKDDQWVVENSLLTGISAEQKFASIPEYYDAQLTRDMFGRHVYERREKETHFESFLLLNQTTRIYIRERLKCEHVVAQFTCLSICKVEVETQEDRDREDEFESGYGL